MLLPPAAYPLLEVWDNTELQQLQEQMSVRVKGALLRKELGAAELRPIVRDNAVFDLRCAKKINKWIKTIHADQRRTW